MSVATVAACVTTPWPLDFGGNLRKVRSSIATAKAAGARYRLGPELELTGAGCEDHFLEADTGRHAWEALSELLSDDLTDGIVCDVGMPVVHRGARHACRVLLLDRRVLLIRPAGSVPDPSGGRGSRWFTPWSRPRQVETFALPDVVRERTGQATTVIGDAHLRTRDARIGFATVGPVAADEAQHGAVDILAASGVTPHELGAMEARLGRIAALSQAFGGTVVLAAARGADGGRTYADGGAMVVVNGELVAQAATVSLHEVEVVLADVELGRNGARPGLRGAEPARSDAESVTTYPLVDADLRLVAGPDRPASPPRPPRLPSREEQIATRPAAWLWDHLRRSGAGGFFLPISGGTDSAAVATVVASMCRLLADALRERDEAVTRDVRRVLGLTGDDPTPLDPRALAARLLTTAYLPTRTSSEASRERARVLADAIGADHLEVGLDPAVEALSLASDRAALPGRERSLRFEAEGGDEAQDLALQNLQARMRMVASYLLAQRTPDLRGVRGPRLVLGTSNLDEALTGYVTKYDASSADLNPIGDLRKADLRRFLVWARDAMALPVLDAVLDATPSAELTLAGRDGPQTDEREIGLTYEQTARLAELRGDLRCGPLETFERLADEWAPLPADEVAALVKRFYRAYARHRHKATIATPSVHLSRYGADDARSDPRPFQLDPDWPWQFRAIDERVARRLADANGAS